MEIRLRNSFRFPNDRSAVTRCVCVCGKKTERNREREKKNHSFEGARNEVVRFIPDSMHAL